MCLFGGAVCVVCLACVMSCGLVCSLVSCCLIVGGPLFVLLCVVLV